MRTLLMLGLVGFVASTAAAQDKKQLVESPKEILARLLKDISQTDDVAQQVQAAMGLADFGADAEPALPTLLSLLESTDEDLRLNAAIALGKIGKASVAALKERLNHADNPVRFYAIWALAGVGPDAKEVAPALVQAMADKDEGIRRKAAYALGRIAADHPQKILKVLLAAFKDPSEDVRQAAGDAVAKYGIEAIPGLITALQDADVQVRVQAAHAVTAIGSEASDTAPMLRELLLAKDESHVHAFAQALGKLGKVGVPTLIDGLKDGRPQVRQACMESLQQVGADAVPALVDGLGDKNVEVRRVSAQVLAPLRVGDKLVVTALAYAIKNDQDDQVRQHCVVALQYLGAAGKLGAPALQLALTDINHQIRQQAFYALQSMGENPRDGLLKALASKDDRIRITTAALMVQVQFEPSTAVPVLVGALKHENGELRMQAAHALAQRQLEIGKVMPLFTEGLMSKTPRVRVQALQGLAMFGGNAGAQVGKVVGALKDPEREVRQQAVYTLQNVAGDLSPHLAELVSLLKDDDANLRASLINLMGRAGEKGVVQLGAMLRDPDEQVRWQAAAALQSAGTHIHKVIPALIEAAQDKNGNVRVYASYALARAGDEGIKALGKAFDESKELAARQQILQAAFSSQSRAQGLPLFKRALKDPSREVRATAIQMSANLGQIQEVSDLLSEALKDEDLNVRVSAAHGLQNFGAKGLSLLERELASAKEWQLRQAILQGLHNHNHRSKAMVGPLTEYLKDEQSAVRWQAAQVLGNIGPDASDAVPTLRTLLKDRDPTVRQHARTALSRIEPKK